MSDLISLASERAIVIIDPDDGGRIVSLVLDGFEIMRDEEFNTSKSIFGYGSFPMAPYSGRIRDGKFDFQGKTFQLTDLADAPHALHGTVIYQSWQTVKVSLNSAHLVTKVATGWPFSGQVQQIIELSESALLMRLILSANQSMPAWIGFHPWFRKEINGNKFKLNANLDQMYLRDDSGITTTELIDSTAPPWDDCFIAQNPDIEISWGETLTIALKSNYPYWVIYSEPEDAICIEPQTAPPNAIELGLNQVVTPDKDLELEFRIEF